MADANTAIQGASKGALGRQRSEAILGYLYILPAFIIISIFGLFPIAYALYMSLYRWKIKQTNFIGFANYQRLLGNAWAGLAFILGLAIILVAHWLWVDAFKDVGKKKLAKLSSSLVLIAAAFFIFFGWRGMYASGDKKFLSSMVRTLFYAFSTIPIQIGLSLAIAYMLFQKIKGSEFYRMLFFLPYVTPAVAAAAVFRVLFSPRETSIANQIIGLVGIHPQKWLFEKKPIIQLILGDHINTFNAWLHNIGIGWQYDGLWQGPSMALVVTTVFGIWTYTGYNIIIFLAGLGGISSNVYEAADIDGASNVEKFWHLTVPLLSPVTFYLTILGFIGALQAFTHVYVMKQPSVGNAVDTASIYIFDTFYEKNNFSLAAAESIILFLVILIITLIQNRLFGGEK